MSDMDKTKELETKSVKHLLLVYALPAVISQVIASVYSIADRVFLGQCVDALAIAGLAITMPVMNIIHAFGSLVGVGSSSRMSIVLGRKDVRWAEKILGNSMLLTFFFGILFMGGGYLFMDQILGAFGASSATVSYAREYMLIVLPGMFLTTMALNLTGLIRASGYPSKSMWIMVIGALLNIAFDALFIYVLDWGIAGAAWATTISMAISAGLAVAHFVSPKSFIRFQRHAWAPKLYIFRNIIVIGMSPFLMNVAASAVVALLNGQLVRFGNELMAGGGDLAVGAYGVINTFGSLLVMVIIGICQGMQPIAGYNYGAGHSHRLREVFLLAMKVNVLVGTLGAILGCCFPRFFGTWFTHDEAMLDIVKHAMPYMMVMWGFIGATITNSNFFQSIDKPWIAIVTSLSRQVIFLIPMIYLVPAVFLNHGGAGLDGVWVACTLSDFFGFALAMVLLLTQRKVFSPDYVAPERRPRKEAGPKDGEQ